MCRGIYIYSVYSVTNSWDDISRTLFVISPVVGQWYIHSSQIQLRLMLLIPLRTASYGKVYRTIFQSKRRRLVFKTGVIMYILNNRRLMRPLLLQLLNKWNITRHPNLKAPVYFSELPCTCIGLLWTNTREDGPGCKDNTDPPHHLILNMEVIQIMGMCYEYV